MNQSTTRNDKPTPAEIAERAYFLYEKEGRIAGRDLDNWLKAELQLFHERQAGLTKRDGSSQLASDASHRTAVLPAGPMARMIARGGGKKQ